MEWYVTKQQTKGKSVRNHNYIQFSKKKKQEITITIENYSNCIHFFAQLCANEFENLDKMQNYLEKYNII